MDDPGLGVPSQGRGDVLPLPDNNPLILLVLRCCQSRVTRQQDALSANVGSSPTLLQRAPDEKKPGTELAALSSRYPEEEEVLRSAIRALESRKFAQGV